MKGMQKISRGSGFAGVMAYAFDGDLDKPRELEGEVIGGNMSGRDPQSLTREFNASKAVRPDVEKPVWHNSLRLPEGDKLSREQWADIGDAYMQKMGFSENHQRAYILHDDKAGQHIHIIASRIGLDGQLFLGKNENLISTKKIAELEREFNLTITKGVNYDSAGKVVMPDVSRPRKGEVGKFERTGEAPSRFALAKLIDAALTDKPSASAFAERLSLSGVEVRANFSKDTLNGFSFAIDGVSFKGSQLGKQYAGKALFERGLSYEQDRDYAFLRELSSAATRDSARAGSAQNPGGLESRRDRAGHEPGATNSSGIWRPDGERADHSEPGFGKLNWTGPGRDREPDQHAIESRSADSEIDKGNERSQQGVGIDPKSSKGRENPLGNTASSGASGLAGGQPRVPGGGGVESGVEITDLGPMHTGDEATDNLLKLAHQGQIKEARESLARQKRMHAESEALTRNRIAEAQAIVNQILGIGRSTKLNQRPYGSRLTVIAARSADSSGWRERDMAKFSKAVGASGFELTFSDPSKKRAPIKRSFTADQLEKSRTVRGLADHFARSGDVLIQPLADDASGVILLVGLPEISVEKLEAVGFSSAAIAEVNGKYQVWIRTDQQLTAEERERLFQRLSGIAGVPQQAVNYGRLPGFSKGIHTVSLVSASGRSAPAAPAMLEEIRAEILDKKISLRLEQAVLARSTLSNDDFKQIGSVRHLKNGWFQETRDHVQADVMDRTAQISNERIETKVLEAMARQKVPISQAYSAVFRESRVSAGIELDAAWLTTHAYARVALEREGKSLNGIDIKAEARRRFPEIIKRAESRVDSDLQAMHEQMKLDGQAEQLELERKANEQRLGKALEAAKRVAHEQKTGPSKG